MVETSDARVSLDEGDVALPAAWEAALDAHAAPRHMSRAVLVRLIIQDWLHQYSHLTQEHRHDAHDRLADADYLRLRVLARITDQRRMNRVVTITALADRLGMTEETMQALVSDLVQAGMLTHSLEPTAAGASILADFSRDTPYGFPVPEDTHTGHGDTDAPGEADAASLTDLTSSM